MAAKADRQGFAAAWTVEAWLRGLRSLRAEGSADHARLHRAAGPQASGAVFLRGDGGVSFSERGMGKGRSHGDGECFWKDCPQLREGEPEKTGRHCPYDSEARAKAEEVS